MGLFDPTKIRNRSEYLGTGYNWLGDGEADSHHTYIAQVFLGAMPIAMSWKRDKDGKYRSGGPWIKWEHKTIYYKSNPVKVFRHGFGLAYEGSFTADHNEVHYPLADNWSVDWQLQDRADSLEARGAEAWNRMRPEAPDFSLALSLAELKDVPSMLKKNVLDMVQKVRSQARRKGQNHLSFTAEWHLAIQFGWLPILSDVRKFVNAQNGKQKRLSQLLRDEGRPIRRRTTLRPSPNSGYTETRTVIYEPWMSGTPVSPSMVNQCYWGRGAHSTTRLTYNDRAWAEARFRYLLPPGPRNVIWTRKMLRRIMGGRVTPSVVYNLMPWSWLVDYFVDLGHFIEAISPGVADKLIADYAYLMEEQEWLVTTEASEVFVGDINGTQPTTASAKTHTRASTMLRVPGSPFGFGVRQEDLTAHQVGILGALGISRLS